MSNFENINNQINLPINLERAISTRLSCRNLRDIPYPENAREPLYSHSSWFPEIPSLLNQPQISVITSRLLMECIKITHFQIMYNPQFYLRRNGYCAGKHETCSFTFTFNLGSNLFWGGERVLQLLLLNLYMHTFIPPRTVHYFSHYFSCSAVLAVTWLCSWLSHPGHFHLVCSLGKFYIIDPI